MGAGGFNGRVRNGIGWNSPARTTSPAKDSLQKNVQRHSERFADFEISHLTQGLGLSSVAFISVLTISVLVRNCLDFFPDMERCWQSSQSSD